MRHIIRHILLLSILFCTSISSVAQAPSGFDYYSKAEVEATIGQDVYYYIQFYDQNMVTYLAEFQGDGTDTNMNLGTKDYFPFAKNIQWRLVAAGEPGQFKLQSANGYYVYYDQWGPRFYDDGQYKTTNDANAATIFDIRTDFGVLAIFNTNLPADADKGYAGLRRYATNRSDPFTKDFRNWSPSNEWGKLRFARLKPNAVHIIYRDQNYGNDNNSQDAVGNRRYLDYAMAQPNSPASNNAAAWLLPNLADNHQDGLWQLEEGDTPGQFYIRRYGTDTYLIGNDNATCTLGAKNAGKNLFTLENIYANRYSEVRRTDANYWFNHANGNGIYFWNDGNNHWYAGFAPVDPSTLTQEKFYLRFVNQAGTKDGDNFIQPAQNVFVTDMGAGNTMQTNADAANVAARTWSFIYLTEGSMTDKLVANQFILQSGLGNYVYLDGGQFKTTPIRGQASVLCFQNLGTDGGSYAICDYISYVTAADQTNPRGCFNSQAGVVLGRNVVEWNRNDNNSALEIISQNPQPGNTYKLRFRQLRRGPEIKDGDVVTNYEYQRVYWTENSADTKISLVRGAVTENDLLVDARFWTLEGTSPGDLTLRSVIGNYAAIVNNKDWPLNPNTHLDNSNANTQLFTTVKAENATHMSLQNYKAQQGTFQLLTDLPNDVFTEGARKYLTHVDQNSDANSRIVFWEPEPNCDMMFIFDPLAYVRGNVYQPQVSHDITHKESYLKGYYNDHGNVSSSTGLTQSMDSEWKIQDGSIHNGTQNTNEFFITHYVKRGEVMRLGMPTTLYGNNRHIYYQRWYNYETENTDGLFTHAYFDISNFGRLQAFNYNNGLVTGDQIYYPARTGDDPIFYNNIRYSQAYFYYTNTDGGNYTVAADVSRYSDYHYQSIPEYLNGNLEEPTLGMRWIYTFKDAKERATELTACTDGSGNWLETKDFHFPQNPLSYEDEKGADAFKGEFIALFNEFRDYWVFSGGTGDEYLKNLNNANCNIQVVLDAKNTGITSAGTSGDRFIHFFYPKEGDNTLKVPDNYCYDIDGSETLDDYLANKAPVFSIYFNDNGTRYQIAKFRIIFDKDAETLSWSEISAPQAAGESDEAYAKRIGRNPKEIRKEAGEPIAKITFDYPADTHYVTPTDFSAPSTGDTKHSSSMPSGTASLASSPLPLTFDDTNYGYTHDGAEWGNYTLVNTTFTRWGDQNILLPANDETYGCNINADPGLQRGFMYIDASEQPGEICHVPFQGKFCPDDRLICTGWITGSNSINNNALCPGSVILTIKGKNKNDTESTVIYRYCTGQVLELPGSTAEYTGDYRYDPIGNPDGNRYGMDGKPQHSQWQQFYFQFKIDQFYDEYWLEVNNNCVNSMGGDFMLDDIEIFAYVPDVSPELNTPLCVESSVDEVMNLFKMNVSFPKLLRPANLTEAETEETGVNEYLNMAILDRDVFLQEYKQQISGVDGLSLDEFETGLLNGLYPRSAYSEAYTAAFDAALLGNRDTWNSSSPDAGKGNGLLTYVWNTYFENMPLYNFNDAAEGTSAVYRYVNPINGEREVVINGNASRLPWKESTKYYIISNVGDAVTLGDMYDRFDISSPCTRMNIYTLKPAYKILGIDGTAVDGDEYQVCEGKTISITTNLSGYNIDGQIVQLEGLNYDWWLGDIVRNTDGSFDAEHSTIPTLANFHAYKRQITINDVQEDVYLSSALTHYRMDYPDYTPVSGADLDVLGPPSSGSHNLTDYEKELLKQLLDEGQIIMGRRSLDAEAFGQQVVDEDNNVNAFYLVACPILDETLQSYLEPADSEKSVYVCDCPQGLKILLDGVSPSLNSGFVTGANGLGAYNYRKNISALSVRMANKDQFETLRHDPAKDITLNGTREDNLLFLPIRDALVQSIDASGVISKSNDENVYLSSTTDPDWDREIQKNITKNGVPPIVGKIVDLQATDTKNGASDGTNRLVVYFYDDNRLGVRRFEVREGYNYTLKVPYQENDGKNKCDGTLLINLKIVPDYEVWTGGAGNTDWSNDENWRRADYNELYAGTGKLRDYVTNRNNYRFGMDQALRKGFAPLYCTHVLMMNTEWGNAPKLYDALDSENKTTLVNAPFPNLRDLPGWDNKPGDEPTAATASDIIKFDMQVRSKERWPEIYGANTISTLALEDYTLDGDLFAEMYQTNTCDEIAFQPGTELLNSHLLNYNTAWVEHELDWDRWYLMGSSLQGTIAGDWYAPTGNGKQQTTYYEPVTFGTGYDRYSPAYFQRGWDKAKTVLYQVGAEYDIEKDPDERITGSPSGVNENDQVVTDEYLYRLGYRWLADGNKANVAIKGTWGNTYNDVTVDYSTGGFTVKALNNLKGKTNTGKTVVRLPKEDTMYDYYKFTETGTNDGGTDTYILDNDGTGIQVLGRAQNRGRLKTDLMLPKGEGFTTMWLTENNQSYGQRQISRIPTTAEGVTSMNAAMDTIIITETLSAGISNLGFYLASNPYQTGLDMDKFFEDNPGLEKKYWIMTDSTGQMLTVKDVLTDDWITQTGEVGSEAFRKDSAVVAPGQGFFVQATNKDTFDGKVNFTRSMQARTRHGKIDNDGTSYTIVVGTQQKMEPTDVQAVDDDNKPLFDNGVAAYVDDELVIIDGNVMVHPYNTEGEVDLDAELVVGVPTWVYTPVWADEDQTIPVMEDITQDITIFKYVPNEEKTNYVLRAPRRRGSDGTMAQGAQQRVAGLTITAQSGSQKSSALLTLSEKSSNTFLPSEDTELFIVDELATAPQVYTLCGRLATVVNRLHDFNSIPIGLESDSHEQAMLTFTGVESLGDSLSIYDAATQTLTPLTEGLQISVPGKTQNRYYIVNGTRIDESIAESSLLIYDESGVINVLSTTGDAITEVCAYDTGGSLLYRATPGTASHRFTLPHRGVYVVKASTEKLQQVRKFGK